MIPFLLSSDLGHTWFIDLDGTILEHNGHLVENDKLLPGVQELWNNIPEHDNIIITTGRDEKYREKTLAVLDAAGLRYNHAIFGLPLGERIIVNDTKPGGLRTAIAWNVERNQGFEIVEAPWMSEWNDPGYQDYKKKHIEILDRHLSDKPKNILDIGCGLAWESREFSRRYNTDIWLLDGDVSDNDRKSSEARETKWNVSADLFRFYNSFEFLKRELDRLGLKNYNLIDCNRIDIPDNTKFDVIWSFLSCGFHYPLSTYRQLIEKHSHPDTHVIVDLRCGLGRPDDVILDDGVEIVKVLGIYRKHITAEVRFTNQLKLELK